jgi:hypothetical protein
MLYYIILSKLIKLKLRRFHVNRRLREVLYSKPNNSGYTTGSRCVSYVNKNIIVESLYEYN